MLWSGAPLAEMFRKRCLWGEDIGERTKKFPVGSSCNSRKAFWKGSGLCKGPEVGMHFAPSRNNKLMSVAGAEWIRGKWRVQIRKGLVDCGEEDGFFFFLSNCSGQPLVSCKHEHDRLLFVLLKDQLSSYEEGSKSRINETFRRLWAETWWEGARFAA